MRDTKILTDNGINIEKSLELFGDMETYDDTLTTFLENIDELLVKMQNHKEAGDMSNYSILVHSLKSDAKYFGFDKLAELAYQHEIESKENNVYYIYNNYDELVNEIKRIIDITTKYLGKSEIVKINLEKEPFSGKRILIVDDSNTIRVLAQTIFGNKFEVIEASDGIEAIKIIENDLGKTIAGMLLDLDMPNADGFEVLEYIKAKGIFDSIPTSIITGIESDEKLEYLSSYPIVDILRKPFNEKNVKDVLEKTILLDKESN